MIQRRSYKITAIRVNGIQIQEAVVDSHYELKHGLYMTDNLILKMVQELDGRNEAPEVESGGYSYFATLVEVGGKQYRLIWLLEDDKLYVGVVNAYRDERNGLMGFPKEKDLEKIRLKLESVDPSRMLPKNASKADRLKYKLCEKFVVYLRENQMTQLELSGKLGIDPSRVNEIVKYKISLYTVDRLMDLAEKLHMDFVVEVA